MNPMETIATPNAIAVLQKLISLHTQRLDGYEKSAKNHPQAFFSRLAEQSREFNAQLMEELALYGDASQSQVTESLFDRVWTESLEELQAPDAQTASQACRDVEEAVIETYEDALADTPDMPDSLRVLLDKQLSELHKSSVELLNPS
jgi:hypothetical protein